MIKQDIYNSNDINIKHDIYIYEYMISNNNKQIVNIPLNLYPMIKGGDCLNNNNCSLAGKIQIVDLQ